MFGKLSVLTEFERDIIREGTMTDLKVARAWGHKDGRPKVNQQKLAQAVTMYHFKRMTIKIIGEATGISCCNFIPLFSRRANQLKGLLLIY
jgi:DNA invertase Pin-like site-specific DNA recombinase